jgi:cytosine/uracil/thiamine/allantoin permease
MSSITIDNPDPAINKRLRIRAASHPGFATILSIVVAPILCFWASLTPPISASVSRRWRGAACCFVSPVVVIVGSITVIIATMSINIVANFVSPAYDIVNLYPERINVRLGGLITSILSVLVCSWPFVASPHAITLSVSIFGAGLGPMFAIIVTDYYLLKQQSVGPEDL